MIIKPDNEMLSYSGRIDFDDRLAPVQTSTTIAPLMIT